MTARKKITEREERVIVVVAVRGSQVRRGRKHKRLGLLGKKFRGQLFTLGSDSLKKSIGFPFSNLYWLNGFYK